MAPQISKSRLVPFLRRCTFRFEPVLPWNVTTLGRFYALVEETYPTVLQARDIRVSLDSGFEKKRKKAEPNVVALDHLHLHDRSERFFLDVDNNSLIVSDSEPTRDWTDFCNEVKRINEKFSKLEISKKTELFVYGNFFLLPFDPEKIVLEDFFKFSPRSIKLKSGSIENFSISGQIKKRRNSPNLEFSLTTARSPSGKKYLHLDIDCFEQKAGVQKFPSISQWLDEARHSVENLVSDILTEKAVNLL